MKVKYDESFEPLRNKHHGYTFVPSGYGNPAMSGQKSGRTRKEMQWLRMQCNQKAVTQWRDMSTATKNAWDLFAASYPQPTKKDPNVYLSGYQLFVKRNTYEFLHEGIDADFIESPELSVLANPDFTAEINDNGMCLDVTEWYLKNFGIMPEVGEFLLCRIIPMAANSGQFFAPLVATLEVEEVFIDGLFLSLFFNGHAPGVVFSVYLSRPVHAGRSYNKTKYRYMGCFKPTQFIQLTDTPDEYTGQAGKFVAVKDTEDGLEFVDAGGGGLTCDDVCECPCIQSIIENVETLSEVAAGNGETSVPAIQFGAMLDYYAIEDARNISSNDDWYAPGLTEWTALIAALGGDTVAGGHLKEVNSLYWTITSAGADNSSKFNARGSGRNSYNGLHASLRQANWIYTSEYYTSTYGYKYIIDQSTDSISKSTTSKRTGVSLHLVKAAPGVPDGTFTTYTGNNGVIYRAVAIGGYYWTADSSKETKWRNGDSIPQMANNTEWYNANTNPKWSYPNYQAVNY